MRAVFRRPWVVAAVVVVALGGAAMVLAAWNPQEGRAPFVVWARQTALPGLDVYGDVRVTPGGDEDCVPYVQVVTVIGPGVKVATHDLRREAPRPSVWIRFLQSRRQSAYAMYGRNEGDVDYQPTTAEHTAPDGSKWRAFLSLAEPPAEFAPDASLAGTWEMTWGADPTRRVVLAADGTTSVLGARARWGVVDGAVLVEFTPAGARRVVDAGVLSADRRSFDGIGVGVGGRCPLRGRRVE